MQTVKTRFSQTGIGSALNIFAHVLAKILARHAFRYATPIAFVGFPTYPRAPSSLNAPPFYACLSPFFFFLYAYIYIFFFFPSRTYIRTYELHARLSDRVCPLGRRFIARAD